MADAGTLATTEQVLLFLGENASTNQKLEVNTNIAVLMAESDMEKAFGDNVGLVAKYGTITAALKQWIALICAERSASLLIDSNPQAWDGATVRLKLNYKDTLWKGFISDLKSNRSDIISDLNL